MTEKSQRRNMQQEKYWRIKMFKGGFTDANNRKVNYSDIVEYKFGVRRGQLIDALQDGDAEVLFYDTNEIESVKWIHLCKVPEEYLKNELIQYNDNLLNEDELIRAIRRTAFKLGKTTTIQILADEIKYLINAN